MLEAIHPSRQRLVRGATLVAVYFLAATALGALRDVLVIHRLGYGVGSDQFFLYTTIPLAYFGISGQATYLPLAIHHRTAARRMLHAVTLLAVLLTLGLAATHAGPEKDYLAAGVIVSILCMATLAVRFEAATANDVIERIGLVALVANVVFIAATFILPRDLAAYVAAYSLSLPIGIAVALPRTFRARNLVSSSGADCPPLMTYAAISIALQAYQLVERAFGVLIGAGIVTSLALGTKLASVPTGVIGYAFGTAIFGGIVAGRSYSPRGRVADRRAGLGLLLTFLAISSGVVALVTYWCVPYIFALLRITTGQVSHYRVLIAFAVTISPWTATQSILNNELLARGRYTLYLSAGAAFIVIFLTVGAGAVVARIGVMLALAPTVASAGQLLVTFLGGRQSGDSPPESLKSVGSMVTRVTDLRQQQNRVRGSNLL